MIFMIVYALVFFGLFMAGAIGLMPIMSQVGIPDFLRYMFFGIGCLLAFIGLVIIQSRASKTGTIHLLEFGKPGTINWIVVYPDGTCLITPAIRQVQGHLYSKELDALIKDFKSYRLFDHSIRFVPDGVGHSVDLGKCLYATFLKTKWGFSNIREARHQGRIENMLTLGLRKTKPVLSEEFFIEGDEDGTPQRQV